MSALARYFSFHGKKVEGYDKTKTALTLQLESEGIPVHYTDDIALAPKDADIIVYTPAVPASHTALTYYRENNFQVVKRSDMLGAITRNSFNICVAGTHGKTTISSMIAHILRHTGYGCNAFLGGIASNYNSNFWSSERDTCVIEADEYDRSFLKLSPDIAVISAMDADHLDIYGTETAMQEAFVAFSGKIKPSGTLFVKSGLAERFKFLAPRQTTYSLDAPDADVHAQQVEMVNGNYLFNLSINRELIDDLALNMGGLHNVENASVAIAVARSLDIDIEAIRLAVEAFRGVKRRFEYIIKTKSLVYIDDYAHHPEELATLIDSAKSLFSEMKCTVIFQPHLFTRTRDLADAFAARLDKADEIVLLPIYPARELPIEGVSSELIKQKMNNRNVRILPKDDVEDFIRYRKSSAQKGESQLFITAGAGDIDTLVNPLKKILSETVK